MAEFTNSLGQHNIIMEGRKKLIISAVSEVESFEEDNAELKTTAGNMTIRGDELKMDNYNSSTGDLQISGNIYAIIYTNDGPTEKGGFIKRIFK